ncbi:hypothetical protein CEXT_490561 [Caerostris extrusa]|uniref:Uncharacterized protein n=1 Tax=Caerostris extrusa TaxID=172846 RepID=A0AAV4MET2_CAEEX|nr:hypothetical protein CEXT_490561 [Caerostris extrusa]
MTCVLKLQNLTDVVGDHWLKRQLKENRSELPETEATNLSPWGKVHKKGSKPSMTSPTGSFKENTMAVTLSKRKRTLVETTKQMQPVLFQS